MATLKYETVDMIAEVCGPEGPTGQYREVIEVAICDMGLN